MSGSSLYVPPLLMPEGTPQTFVCSLLLIIFVCILFFFFNHSLEINLCGQRSYYVSLCTSNLVPFWQKY